MRIAFKIIGPLLAGTALTLSCCKQNNLIGEKEVRDQLEIIRLAMQGLSEDARESNKFFERLRKSGVPEREIQAERGHDAQRLSTKRIELEIKTRELRELYKKLKGEK